MNTQLQQLLLNSLNTEAVLKTLTPREEKIIKILYGIDDRSDAAKRVLSVYFNVSQDRIEQIIRKAERKLSHPNRLKLL